MDKLYVFGKGRHIVMSWDLFKLQKSSNLSASYCGMIHIIKFTGLTR